MGLKACVEYVGWSGVVPDNNHNIRPFGFPVLS